MASTAPVGIGMPTRNGAAFIAQALESLLAQDHGDFEILTTGPKWYDTRARKGGGGAIDLAMHVLGLSFVDAVRRLTEQAGLLGPDHP